MKTYRDTHRRSVIKAISWRFIASLTTVVIVFCLTRFLDIEMSKSIKISGIAGVADVILKLTLYYLHERVWGVIGFGKENHPLAFLDVDKPLEQGDMNIVKNKLKELGYISEE